MRAGRYQQVGVLNTGGGVPSCGVRELATALLVEIAWRQLAGAVNSGSKRQQITMAVSSWGEQTAASCRSPEQARCVQQKRYGTRSDERRGNYSYLVQSLNLIASK